MSGLEQRCQQFHEAALGTGKSKSQAKEVTTLRRFLHKNQDQRFTDKAVSRLFDTIQLYCVRQAGTPDGCSQDQESLPTEMREGLLEDALKMPFTVFNSKQKQKMMRWLDDLRGQSSAKNDGSATVQEITAVFSVIDLDDGFVTLMADDETGDTHEQVELPKDELGAKIKKAYENTDESVEVRAKVNKDDNTVVVTDLLS